ncbi:MAG TPA: MFS transporter [Chthoniobacterales bacterium]|nr:MFS transporter [Chthoniobacterales bacterium]
MKNTLNVHYAWVVAGMTFLILLLGAGVRATPSILLVPLEKEFGWSAATISASIAVNIFLFGMIGPFAVAVMERFGLRRTVSFSLVVLNVGVALTALMRAPWQMMVLWGFLVGSGTGMIAMVLGATVAERWFVQNRGLVLGILTASSATGQLIFLPLLATLSVNFGWRVVSLTVALIALVMAPIAALLLRNRPSDIGLPRYGEIDLHRVERRSENPAHRALSALRRGLLSRDFWLLSGTFFICGASTNGLIGTHLIPACIDRGIPEVGAANLLAVIGVFDLVGTTVSGWLTDRFDSRRLLAWYYALRGLSLIFLPIAFNFNFYGLSIYAVFYGLDWVATVPPTVRLAGNVFGEENAALMFGWIAASHQIGAAAVAWLAGILRTQTGDYSIAFFTSGLLCLLAAVLASFIGATTKRHLNPEPILETT